MISIELWRARIGQFNAKCHSGRRICVCLSFQFYPYSSRRRKNDVSSQDKDPGPSLIAAVSTTSSPPSTLSPAKKISSFKHSPPLPAVSTEPSTTSHASSSSSSPSSASTYPSPAKKVSSKNSSPDAAPPSSQAHLPSSTSHASSCSSYSSTLFSLLPSSYSSGVLQCRSVLREALIILLIAIISQQLILSAGDVETNPGPIACEY